MGPATLFGRTAVLEGLVDSALLARSVGARFIVVEGEPGIGKSALVDVFAAAAADSGFRVLRAAADELEGRQSFGLIVACLGTQWMLEPTDIAGVGHGQQPALAGRGGDWTGRELQVSEAAIAAVEVRCSEGPVAMVLEDLHWSDPGSLFVLRRLMRHAASLPLVLVGTTRPTPHSSELRALLRDVGDAGRIALGPLDGTALEMLARRRLGAAPGPRLVAQIALAGGNPLYVLELLETLRLDGALRRGDGPAGAGSVVEVDRTDPPPSLLMTIVRHLSFLPAATLQALSVAAVLGVRFRPSHLAAVVGRPMAELLGPLGDAVAIGLLSEEGEELAFRHELLREALYADLPLGVRSGLHRDVARALEGMDAPAALVAEHLVRGAEPGDDDAARYLGDAARQLALEAPDAAVGLLERAIALARPAAPIVPALRADLAVALLWSGRALEGEAHCRAAMAQLTDRAHRALLRQCLVESLLARGQVDAVLAEVAEAAADVADDPVLQARLDGIAANALVFLGRVEEATALAVRAEQVGTRAADAELTVQALVVQALLAERRGAVEEAAELSGRAAGITTVDGTRRTHRRLAHLAEAMALIDLDRFDSAIVVLQRSLEIHESFGTQDALALLHIGLGFARFWSGEWDEAEVELDTGLALAEETGTGWRAAARGLRAVIALGRGDTGLAEDGLRLARHELTVEMIEYRIEWLDWATALWCDAVGQPAVAARALRSAAGARATGRISPGLAAVAPTAVRLSVAEGDTDAVRSVVATLDRLALGNPGWRGAQLAAATARATLAGDGTELAAAATTYHQAARPVEAALVAEHASAVLGAAGSTEESRRCATDAARWYRQLGATVFASRALRHNPSQAGPGGVEIVRRGERIGWGSLTPAEMRVLRLLAERRSNPEIATTLQVSRRTVETHVSHIFTKVGLRSRVELCREAARQFGWRLRLEELAE